MKKDMAVDGVLITDGQTATLNIVALDMNGLPCGNPYTFTVTMEQLLGLGPEKLIEE